MRGGAAGSLFGPREEGLFRAREKPARLVSFQKQISLSQTAQSRSLSPPSPPTLSPLSQPLSQPEPERVCVERVLVTARVLQPCKGRPTVTGLT